MIFFPRFSIKTMTFVISIIFTLAFISLLVYNYSKAEQNDFTWNCSLFELQNKYYPRLRYSYQFWRIPISAIFHSNILHFVLNVLGLQIYGYFVEWYLGKKKLICLFCWSIVLGHLLSCLAFPTSISTTSSSILSAILTMKAYFFF